MSHIVGKSAYKTLEERLNTFPQGVPPSESLYKILSILFDEKEAQLVSQLPIKPFTVKKASEIWGVSEEEAAEELNALAAKALLLDIDRKGVQTYVLPPPMAGFFEFSMMRTRGDIDQKVLSELFYQYLNVEEDFIKALILEGETKLGRVLVNEYAMTIGHESDPITILDYERATHIIDTAEHIGVSMCYCRHKMEHLGKACDAPMDICMTFGNTAASLIKHGHARRVDAQECKKLLKEAYDHNLVQCAENVREKVAFICNCCGCCCEFLMAARKFAPLHVIETSNYMPSLNEEGCVSCKKCVRICPIGAIKFENDKIHIDEEICIGCGVCSRACPTKTIVMLEREKRVITPINSVHRIVLMAIERGKLQNLIFDNKALFSHRAMGTILGAILKLPPAKQLLANKQLKSVYLEKLLANM